MSIRPGPWWLNPLWSLRQQVEVRRIFSDGTGARHGRLMASCSHFVCWTVIDARHHRERFIGREHAMTSREEVALQPPLTEVFAEDLHHSAIRSHVVVNVDAIWPTEQRFSTAKTLPRRLEFVSSGQKSRKFVVPLRSCRASFCPVDGSIRATVAGLATGTSVLAEIGQVEVLA